MPATITTRPVLLGPQRLIRPYKGFPKKLPCLVCDRPRRSTWPGDRIHAACRRACAQMADTEMIAALRFREKEPAE